MPLQREHVEQPYRRQLREGLADELYRRALVPQLFLLPVLLLLYLLLNNAMAQRPLIVWLFALIALLQIPRMLMIRADARRQKQWTPDRRVWVFAIGACVPGVGLGTIYILAAPYLSGEQAGLLACAAAGINSVSIISMNPSLRAYFMAMVPHQCAVAAMAMLCPVLEFRGILLILVASNMASLGMMAIRAHRHVCQWMLLRFKVDDANAALVSSNTALQSEIAERQVAEANLATRNQELEVLNEKLAGAQSQLLQSEKMASIGQLAAGVAHEINNPIAFVSANLRSLKGYAADMVGVLERMGGPSSENRSVGAEIDTEFLKGDIPALLDESIDGIVRVEKIVKDLKEFSHLDAADWQWTDLHRGLDTTLNVAAHELKYRVDVVKNYGELPLVECLPFQINQVFLNLLVNAAQSMSDYGTISLTTGHDQGRVWIEIRDTGKGIPDDDLKRIFEPFFTTKDVGAGTGLGLSVSYSIIRKHGGTIDVSSVVGKGSAFTIRLPVHRVASDPG